MATKQPILVFEEWFKSLKNVKVNNGPANGTIGATLVLLERLKENYDLEFSRHLAQGGAQIKGASGAAVAAVLAKFGELRPFAREGGRTNRGVQGDIRPLFQALAILELDLLPSIERNVILTSFQAFLVEKVRDFHNRQKIRLVFDQKLTTWHIIHDLLVTAQREGKAGSVAQHLVGAKLQLLFPNLPISNESTTTADKPTNRAGDFVLGSTVFHVTVAPMESVYRKCQENLDEGLKVYLIVPDSKLLAARQLAEEFCSRQIAVESIESFVSQNIEEVSVFSIDELKHNLVKLFQIYNERVNNVEIDKSLMIELPANLNLS